ncbi:hypothetical protein [Actinocrispum sp. NPDC049592]|uniref:hypothetical protein n=1 Tax=Actinocrispum sp. NPDC049592 TaxID=3154835 RepID=UPI00342CF041
MIGLRILEEQLARPVLMAFGMAFAIAPVVSAGVWLATSTTLTLAGQAGWAA